MFHPWLREFVSSYLIWTIKKSQISNLKCQRFTGQLPFVPGKLVHIV